MSILQKESDYSNNRQPGLFGSVYSTNRTIGMLMIFFVLAGLGGAFLYFKKDSLNIGTDDIPPPEDKRTSINNTGVLPDIASSTDGNGFDPYGDGVSSIEGLLYADFYDLKPTRVEKKLKDYSLPMNIKTDTANYYDISRKINLDAYIDDLNNNGFAIADGSAFGKSGDFFGFYRDLLAADYPIAITEDFVIYQYSNVLKGAYKEIEKSVFYENLWDISKRMFDISFARYKKRSEEVGLSSDTALEAARMEASYFAVALKLLEPGEGQVNSIANFTDGNKFTEQEASTYSFDLPEYFDSRAIQNEVKKIREARGESKSQVMFYPIDYTDFWLSKTDKENARLSNFYLAKRWLSSPFPLNFKDSSCQDCLLDRDDWRISFMASLMMAADFHGDKEVKNKWAVIYKIISYFSGLRQDLTFIDYHRSLESVYGKGYSESGFWKKGGEDLDVELDRLRGEISASTYTGIEGGYDRKNPDDMRKIGLRLLQDPYWPNNYLFSSLTGKDMAPEGGAAKRSTACDDKMTKKTYRCSGFGLDVISLIHKDDYGSYYDDNTSYRHYDERFSSLALSFDKFDKSTWNNNIYWSYLDIIDRLFRVDAINEPYYATRPEWLRKKVANTSLGSWVSLHLPEEKLENFIESEIVNNFSAGFTCNMGNYIEPSVALYDEIEAKNLMLISMFEALKVTDRTVAANNSIKDFNKKIRLIRDISKRQLEGIPLADEHCKDIKTLAKSHQVSGESVRSFVINQGEGRITESISGMKALILIYTNSEGKNVIAVGPIFNYFERK